jgi:hypothetical protein
MSVDANRTILRRVFDATAQGDGRAFIETLADDVTWTIIGSTAWSCTYSGKQKVMAELLGPLSDQLDGPNTIIADHMIAEGDRVAVVGHGQNRTKTGNDYRNSYCWIIRMAGGKMAEITEFADTHLIATALEPPIKRGK